MPIGLAGFNVNKAVDKFDGTGDVSEWIDQVRITKRVMKLSNQDVAGPCLPVLEEAGI